MSKYLIEFESSVTFKFLYKFRQTLIGNDTVSEKFRLRVVKYQNTHDEIIFKTSRLKVRMIHPSEKMVLYRILLTSVYRNKSNYMYHKLSQGLEYPLKLLSLNVTRIL